MQTTIKRTSISLTKETDRQLKEIKLKFGENQNQVITRAIYILYKAMKSKLEYNLEPIVDLSLSSNEIANQKQI